MPPVQPITRHPAHLLRRMYPATAALWDSTAGLSWEQAHAKTGERSLYCIVDYRLLKRGQTDFCSPACMNAEAIRIESERQASYARGKARLAGTAAK